MSLFRHWPGQRPAPAAASLAGISGAQARSALAELTRAHLLTKHMSDRFAFHDLLRAYADEQACAVDSDAERRAAMRRMLDHYLHTGHAATRLLEPDRVPITLDRPGRGVTPEELAGYGQARRWFATERRVLLAATAGAADEGFDTDAFAVGSATSPRSCQRDGGGASHHPSVRIHGAPSPRHQQQGIACSLIGRAGRADPVQSGLSLRYRLSSVLRVADISSQTCRSGFAPMEGCD